jgi:hypothetical protein
MKVLRLVPLAVLLLFLLAQGAAQADGPFTPTFLMTGDEVAPGDPTTPPADDECPVSAPCKILYAEDIPDGQPSGGISVFAPAAIQQFASDAIVPDGAIVGYVSYTRRSTTQLGTCPSTGTMVSSEYEFLEGTTDPTTTTGSPSDVYSFSNWPTQLNDFRDMILNSFPGSALLSRWVKPTLDGPNNVLVFKQGDSLLYWVAPVGDPTLPPVQDCGPLTLRYVALGVTADNPSTPADEGGIPLVTCAAPGTQTYTLRLDRDDTPEWDPVVLTDTITCSPNTPSGSDVSVRLNGGTDVLAGMDVTFSSVTTGGTTSVVTRTEGPPPPPGFKIVGLGDVPLYFDINTDVSYSGALTLCVRYDETQVEGPEAALRLMHRVDDGYVDVTTSVDEANDIICGSTTHLSIFVVVESAPAVGGIVELQRDGAAPAAYQSDSAVRSSIVLAGAAAVALLALTAGAWYARRRWLG